MTAKALKPLISFLNSKILRRGGNKSLISFYTSPAARQSKPTLSTGAGPGLSDALVGACPQPAEGTIIAREGRLFNVFEVDGGESRLIHADFRSRKILPQRFDDRYDKLNQLYEALTGAGIEIALDPQMVILRKVLCRQARSHVICLSLCESR